MDNEKKFYVYMYTSPSGKHYVGRTHQTQRQRAGIEGCGYKNCTAFWNAIQKYGWENFTYRILEEDILENNIDERELYWMSYYNSSTDRNGYNLKIPGDNGGTTFSSEAISRLAESHLNKKTNNKVTDEKERRKPRRPKTSEETKEKLRNVKSCKPVKQFDFNGNYIAEYRSRAEAARAVGTDKTSISACCRGKINSCCGYLWCDVGNEESISKYNPPLQYYTIAYNRPTKGKVVS